MRGLLPFLAALLAVAFFTRVDAFFHLLYAIFGIYVLGRWWARRSQAAVVVQRRHDGRVFLGHRLDVEVEISNRGRLPVLWLRLTDTVPAELAPAGVFRHVVSLGPRERLRLSYSLCGRRRGYYELGPLRSTGGDLLGTARYDEEKVGPGSVVVYPKIVPLHELGFPSQSPFGTLPSQNRVFEDPSRIQGVRAYQPGDPLKRIDWKTSARVASLQVRRYEPTMALETALFLNLDSASYSQPERHQATELGIIIAASLAVHVCEKRQAVSLQTNGADPLGGAWGSVPARGTKVGGDPWPAPGLPMRSGRDHLMHVLDLLARVQVAAEGAAMPFLELLNRKSLALPWGSTIVVITSREAPGLLDTMLALRRRGLLVILALTCPDAGFDETAARASQIGVHVLRMWAERDLDIWR